MYGPRTRPAISPRRRWPLRPEPVRPEIDFSQAPFLVFWELTRACPLACRHCRAVAQPHRHPQELTTQEGLNLLDQIKSMGTPLVIITGGDPVVRPDLLEFIRYGVGLGLRVSLAPSATARLTPHFLEEARQGGLGRVSLSLDGSSPDGHDRFRGVPGSYEQTAQAIHRVKESGLPFQINTTVTQYNRRDLEALAKYVADSGAVLWDLFFLVPTGRGQEGDMLSPQEHEEALRWLYQLSQQAPFEVKTTAAEHYRRVVRQNGGGFPGHSKDGLGRAVGVNDGRGCLFVSHIGEVCPSGFLPLVAGQVRQDPLAQIYRQSPLFLALRDPDQLKGKCGRCQYRTLCGGSRARAYAVTGDPLEAEPCCIYEPDPSPGRQGVE